MMTEQPPTDSTGGMYCLIIPVQSGRWTVIGHTGHRWKLLESSGNVWSLLGSKLFLLISPAKFGHLGAFYLSEVTLDFCKCTEVHLQSLTIAFCTLKVIRVFPDVMFHTGSLCPSIPGLSNTTLMAMLLSIAACVCIILLSTLSTFVVCQNSADPILHTCQFWTFDLWTMLSHLYHQPFLPCISLKLSTSATGHFSNLRHLRQLNVILPPLQATSRSSRPSRPATQEHHHMDRLLVLSPVHRPLASVLRPCLLEFG